MKNNVQIYLKWILLCLQMITGSVLFESCKKFIEVQPPSTSITTASVFEEDESAIAAVTSLYSQMSSTSFDRYFAPTTSVYWGLFSDELKLFPEGNTNISYQQAYTNNLNSESTLFYWQQFYNIVYQTNLAIERLSVVNTLDADVKNQLLGEAKFVRAFCYFYLTNLYGKVPLVLGSNYIKNSNLERTDSADVYAQIVADLKDAREFLSANYLDGNLQPHSEMRTRPCKWVADALLSRTYLYMKNYADAATLATTIIDNRIMFDTVSLSQAFAIGNKECIWQLQAVIPGLNTTTGYYLTIPESRPNEVNAFGISDRLNSSFEHNDKRAVVWVGNSPTGSNFYYPAKYKAFQFGDSDSEYEVVLRLSEQYLIRAEANVHLGKLQEGLDDLNIIRAKAGLNNKSLVSKEVLVNDIINERYVEFFSEWGHRWFDLKRTNLIDSVMSAASIEKSSTWKNYKQLLPIKNSELQSAPNLSQTPGYN